MWLRCYPGCATISGRSSRAVPGTTLASHSQRPSGGPKRHQSQLPGQLRNPGWGWKVGRPRPAGRPGAGFAPKYSGQSERFCWHNAKEHSMYIGIGTVVVIVIIVLVVLALRR